MFDTPSGGTSPVPAQYGSLGGGLPDAPDRIPRERKPFRWKMWREEEAEADGADPVATPGHRPAPAPVVAPVSARAARPSGTAG
ncbi:MAG: hypothetical protein M3063_00450, partial [Actinomycetota bacterium]|nr:hypothetical protein [Actinomycetota bacterium]